MGHSRGTLAGFLLFAFPVITYADDATISICAATDYADLRSCAQSCFDHGACGTLAEAISCWVNDKALNSCYCRSDLIPEAKSYLSTCVASSCSNTLDIASAVNVYTSYCVDAAAAATATPTSPFLTQAKPQIEDLIQARLAAEGGVD